jgi:hypothetical protein
MVDFNLRSVYGTNREKDLYSNSLLVCMARFLSAFGDEVLSCVGYAACGLA